MVNGDVKGILKKVRAGARCISHKVTARQTTALFERPLADGGDAAGEGHARQTTAPFERKVADLGDAAGEGHARQTTAPIERRGADGRDRQSVDCVWDD